MKFRRTISQVGLWACLLCLGMTAHAAGPYNGTAVGSPPYAAAQPGFGQALNLTANSPTSSTQYVTIPSPSGPGDFAAGTAWTAQCWSYNTVNNTGNSYNMLVFNGSGSADNYWISLSSGKPNMFFAGMSGGSPITGSTVVSLNAWHHWALVYIPGTGGALWLDGVKVLSSAGTYAPVAATQTLIGSYRSTGLCWNGYIDDVCFDNYAVYTVPFAVPTAPDPAYRYGRTAHYPFDGSVADTSAALPTFTRTAPIVLGAIGDSITAGAQPGVSYTTVQAMANRLSAMGASSVTVSDQAISGTETADWVPGSTTTSPSASLSSAVAAMKTAGVTHVVINLGVNDFRGGAFSPTRTNETVAQAVSDMRLIIAYVQAQMPGVPIFLNGTAYVTPQASNAGGTTGATVDTLANMALFAQFQSQERALCDNKTIFEGDFSAFGYFAEFPDEFYTNTYSDSSVVLIHPNQTGADSYGTLQAFAFAQDLTNAATASTSTVTDTSIQADVIAALSAAAPGSPAAGSPYALIAAASAQTTSAQEQTNFIAALNTAAPATPTVNSLYYQIVRIFGAEWGTITKNGSSGYNVQTPGGTSVVGTVAPVYASGVLQSDTKTVN